jgi:hypothetical protein
MPMQIRLGAKLGVSLPPLCGTANRPSGERWGIQSGSGVVV